MSNISGSRGQAVGRRASTDELSTAPIIDKIRQKSIIEITGNEQFEIIMQYRTTKFHSKIPSDIHFATLREVALLSTKLSSQFEYSVKWLTQNHLNPQLPYEEFIDESITDIYKDSEGDNLIIAFNKTWMVIISLTDKQQVGPRRPFVGLVNSG